MSNTCGSTLLARFLRICDQQSEAGSSLLALAEDLLVGPETAVDVSIRENGAFVATGVPPTADAGDDFPDRFVI